MDSPLWLAMTEPHNNVVAALGDSLRQELAWALLKLKNPSERTKHILKMEKLKQELWALLKINSQTSERRVSASEFARFMNKSRQTIHLWARTGFLTQLGYTIKYDITRHLSIGIAPTHDQYQAFLAWSAKRQERQER